MDFAFDFVIDTPTLAFLPKKLILDGSNSDKLPHPLLSEY
jgi:hypothetical protein